jgi:predicted MFS family arabinose efflux permease
LLVDLLQPDVHRDGRLTDKRKAWLVMVVVFVASIAISANRFKVPPVLPVLMDELQVDMVTGGWLMSLSALAGIILAIPAAFLLTRIGLKVTGLIAMTCAIAGGVLGALATGASMMLLGRVIEGISVSLMVVLAPTTVSLWFPPRERGLPMGIWATWVPVGNVLMFNVAHPLMNALGWRAVWWFGVLLSAIGFVLIALVVDSPSRTESGKSDAIVPAGDFGRLLLNPSSWLLALSFAIFGFFILAYNTWAPTYLTDTLDVKPDTASFYASLMFLAGIPANILAGWLLNRMKDRHRLLPTAFLATTVLVFWGFRLGSVSVVVPYMIALGLASNFVPTTTFTLAPETMPSVQFASLGLGIVIAGTNVGSLTGPPALGAIVSTAGWTTASTFLVIVMSIGTIVSWRVAKKLRVS